MNLDDTDLYQKHRQAVAIWRKACEEVEFAENERNKARQVLDGISQELLASCADSSKPPAKLVIKRGRRPKLEKMNGVDVKALMRQPSVPNVLD